MTGPLVLMVAGALAYANSLAGPFVFDDRRSIIDNPTIRQLSDLLSVLHPPAQTPVTGRPVVNLSLAINHALGGFDVTGYHIWNVAVHVLASLVLFGILRRLTAWVSPEDHGATDRWALVAALAWLLHPLNTEAVDYVTQRTESMVGLFFLLTIYGSLRAWTAEHAGRWQAAAVVASLCGMATKESMATVPIVVVLCDRIFFCTSIREAFSRRARFYGALAAGWILLAVFARETPFFSPTGFETHVSRWTYLLNQAPAIVHYLRLSAWPRSLVFDYGTPMPLTLQDVWPSAVLVAALMALTGVALARAPKLGFWGAWFFITLAPASSLVPIPTEVAAERRMYLPLIAVIVVAVVLVRLASRRLALQAAPLGLAVAVAVLVAFGAATIQRNTEYHSGVAIWESVVARHPHPRAHGNLAVALRDEGRDDEAIAQLKLAAADLPDARHALGSALRERGDLAGAITELEEFLRMARPGDPELAAAREELVTARRALLIKLLQDRRFQEAEAQAHRLLDLRSGDAEAHNLLGVALASQGRTDEAGVEFAEAVRLKPDYQEARNNLERANEIRRRP